MAKTSKPKNEPDTGREVDADRLRQVIEESVSEAPKRPGLQADDEPSNDALTEVTTDDASHSPTDTDDVTDMQDASDDAAQQRADDAPQPVEPAPWGGAEAASAPSTAESEPVVIRKGGFLPTLLGGVLAAAIGFGAAVYILPEIWPGFGRDDGFEADVSARLDDQAQAIEALQGAGPDLDPIEARLDELEGVRDALDTLRARVEEQANAIPALETRLSDLEQRPITEGASPEAVAAYERELQAVQDAMATQRAEIEALLAEAAEKEASAEMSAQEAATRAAMTRILTALDTGTSFAEAAEDLDRLGMDLPPELAGAADAGVDTMAELAAAFPDAARGALAAARKEDGGGFGSFLKDQLEVRSLEPREGDDADAILSRAEAAVREGRLRDAMAEIDTLPGAARAAMSGWMDRAQARADAIAAADTLGAELDLNRG